MNHGNPNASDEPSAGGQPLQRRSGIVIDPRYAGHCMGPDEPECPARLDVLLDLLKEPTFSGIFTAIAPSMIDEGDLARVHSAAHIRHLASTAGKPATYLDEDTLASPRSNAVAQLAAGGLCRAVDAVQSGHVDNAIALVRPPGHHAERKRARGFCLYNNVAVAARYAQSKLGLKRILIVDWDLHHGNGTQQCFEDDPSVLFISIHQSFTFPHSGRLRDVGRGRGKGYTVNVPLPAGFGDGEYLMLFTHLVKPLALAFQPELVLVSAGFDIHADDPLGGMRVTPAGFAGMTRVLLEVADRCCRGKLVMTLEGGYHLGALKDSVRDVLMEMSGRQYTALSPLLASADPRRVAYTFWRVKRVHGRYWPVLRTAAPPVPDPALLDRLKGDMARWIAFFQT